MQDGNSKSSWRRDAEIFVVSALILYLELILIRWIGTEVRIFAYLGNLILVACFFGTGLGCYRAARPASLMQLGICLLFLTGLVANPLHLEFLNLKKLTDWLAGFEESPMWGMLFIAPHSRVAIALVAVGALLSLTIFIFVPTGQILGRALGEHPRAIWGYSINIAGSLTGIWLFTALSWCQTTPVEWFGILALLAIVLASVTGCQSWWFMVTLGITVCSVWIGQPRGVRTIWSPYQKLEVRQPFLVDSPKQEKLAGAVYTITANGTGYQLMLNLADDFLRTHPRLYNLEQARLSHYNLAFQFKPGIQRLLILGAGAGNNAAAALRHGVEQIDCVEIDPAIYALGKELHPERPYDSTRVHVHVTDARAFLKSATGSYDMIWFALLDAQPGTSYNNRQVDHYMYTLQSFQEARRLLAPDGVLLVNFASRREWISERLYGLLQQVFGRPPLAFLMKFNGSAEYGPPGELTLVTGNGAPTWQNLPANLEGEYLRSCLLQSEFPVTTRITTDDWPYLYLRYAKIPRLHYLTALCLLGIVLLFFHWTVGASARSDGHYFFLGAAFLLLEVQTVSRATLLFGMTWVVNAIVISAVLVMILLANLVAARWSKLPVWMIGTGLLATIAALALVPLDSFNVLTGVMKLMAASAFLTAPVFFAGLIFIQSFAGCATKPQALGSNLIGALAGGLLQSLSFMTGIRALILLVGAFYLIALWLRPVRHRVS